jgi:SAM-dependent methyltransferase
VSADFTTVTEAPGDALRAVALDMLATRYTFAAERAAGRRVLEAGCGPGQGLGLMAKRASFVVGGDYTERLIGYANARYRGRVPLLRLDAQALPFAPGAFDLVVFYEALYYLRSPEAFLAECRRVLRAGGEVLLCTANRVVPDFNPSPFSVRYHSSEELRDLFGRHGFDVEISGAFRAEPTSAADRVISLIKRAAVALHLVPKTMKGKALLKRVFFGPLQQAPAELDEAQGRRAPLEPVPAGADDAVHRVLFVHARLRP